MNTEVTAWVSTTIGVGAGLLAPFAIHSWFPLEAPAPLFIAVGVGLLTGGVTFLGITGTRAFFRYLDGRQTP